MTAPRTHYADAALASGLVSALCGHLPDPSHATRDREAVTCRLCLRRLEAVPFAPSELTEDEPWSPPPPRPMAIKGSRWGDMPGHVRRLAERRSGGRSSPRYYRTVEDAARVIVLVGADGYASGSASQAVERIGQTGTLVQTSGRGSARTTNRAEEVATLKIAVRTALETLELPAGVDARMAWRIYRDRRVGRPTTASEWEGRAREERTHLIADDTRTVAHRYGVSVSTVDVTCLDARRAIHIELQVRGLMKTTDGHRLEVVREQRRREARRRME